MQKIYLALFAIVLAVACVMFSVDRVRINRRYDALGSRIDEKTGIIQKNLDDFAKERAAYQTEIKKLQARFQFVTEEKHPEQTQVVPAEFVPVLPPQPDEDRKIVQDLIRQTVGHPVPADIQKGFRNYCDSAAKLPDQLYFEPETGLVIDRNAAILEAVCRHFGLPVRTTLQWNMADLTRRTATVIEPVEKPLPGDAGKTVAENPPAVPVTVYCGDSRFREKNLVEQSGGLTTVFPFQVSALHENDAERELMMNLHQLPIGGRYVHLIRIQRPAGSKLESASIEYELPTPPEGGVLPRLQAVSLCAGSTVKSSVAGDIQTFRVTFAGDSCEILIVCDSVTIPKRIAVALFSGKPEFLPKP